MGRAALANRSTDRAGFRLLALTALASTCALLLVQPGTQGPQRPVAAPAAGHDFLASLVGPAAPRAPLHRRSSSALRVSLGGRGVAVRSGPTHAVLATVGIGTPRRWNRHANGVTRATSFGAETITVRPGRTEIFLRVDRRQQRRVWRWSLATSAKPKLLPSGAVALIGRRSLRIQPARIYGLDGEDVTPAGTRWSLSRVGRNWELRLPLSDAKLPVPYVVDPEIVATVDYHAVIGAGGLLTHEWRLDETSGTLADSAGGVDGTPVGTPAPLLGQPPLLLGSTHSATLTGSNAIELGSATPRVGVFTPSTVEAWIQIPSGTPGDMPIFSNREGFVGNMVYFAVTDAGGLLWYDNDASVVVGGGFGIKDGARHQVAYTYDGGTVSLYLDGAEVISTAAFTTVWPSTNPAYIGFDAPTGQHFTGTIDDVSTYSTRLTASQVRSHFLAGTDNTAPGLTASSTPAFAVNGMNYTSSASAAFTFGATGSTAVACDVDGTAVANPCASPQALSGLADGAHHFTVTAGDDAGNMHSIRYDWTVDTLPPDTAFAGGPPNPSSNASPTFGFTQTDANPGSFECSVDGGAYVACTSGQAFGPLGNGVHTIDVRAIDLAGNVDATPVHYGWVIDSAAPAVTVSTSPTDPTGTAGAITVTFGAKDGAGTGVDVATGSYTREIGTLAGGACSAWGAPQTITGSVVSSTTYTEAGPLATGCYRYAYSVADAAGNSGTGSTVLRVDRTAPTGTITAPAPGSLLRQTVALESSDAADAQLSVASVRFEAHRVGGAGGFQPIGTSTAGPSFGVAWNTRNVSDGQYELRAVVTDTAGNDATSATVAVTVDNTPPSLTLTSGPADGSGTTSASASFGWTTEAGATVQWQFDSGATGTADPATVSGLSEGPHTFTITAVDAAGNPTPLTRSWTVDTTAPTGTLVSPASGNVLASPIGFDVSAADNFGVVSVATIEGATTRATLHLAAGTSLNGMWTGSWGGIAPGTHTVSIVITDLGGNTKQIPLVVTVPAPAAVVPAGPLDVTPPTAPQNFLGNVEGASDLVLYWDPARDNTGVADYGFWVNGTWVRNYGSSEFQATVGGFGVGDTRTFQVNAIDAAGNVGPFAPALTGVPSVIGRSQADAAAALVARGFRVGTVTNRAAPQEPGTVLVQTPAAPAVAPVGSAVDLVVSQQGGQAKLVMAITAARRVVLARRNFVSVRVQLSLPSNVSAALQTRAGRTIATWRKSLDAGETTVRLTLPRSVARGGRYRLVVSASTVGGQSVRRTVPVTVVAKKLVRKTPGSTSG